MQVDNFSQQHYFVNNNKIYKFLFDNKIVIECVHYDQNIIFEINNLLTQTTSDISEILLEHIHKSTEFLDKIFVNEKYFMKIISWLKPLDYYQYKKYLYEIIKFVYEDLYKISEETENYYHLNLCL